MPDRSPSQEVLDDLRAYITREVRGGFAQLKEIAESAVEVAQEDDASGDDLRPYADRYLAEVVAEVREEQKSWPPVTDCDRLDEAFSALEAGGVLARQDFSCCQNCGHGEIWDEVKSAIEGGRAILGYAFYHQQDTERAVEGGGLYIAYGAAEQGEEAAVAVGMMIAEALKSRGIEVIWDGTVKKRIYVKLNWQRRRTEPLVN